MAKHKDGVDNHTSKLSTDVFGHCYTLAPRSQHTHTAILLHGRGSTGSEFAEDLLKSTMDGGESLSSALPSWRWVFPSSRDLWSTAFQEDIPAWFEAHSLTDTTARQGLQIDGIRESVQYIRTIISDEIDRLHGNSKKVFLGGISQGSAIGLWTLLAEPSLTKRLGGFVGASTWLPFATNIERVLQTKRSDGDDSPTQENGDYDCFVREMMPFSHTGGMPYSPIPILLGHGRDDAYVDIELGRQAAQVMERCGMAVRFIAYEGAEQEGHWLKEPEQIEDIHDFFVAVCASSS